MEYPFIDAKGLSDDELMRRIQRCTQVLAGEMRMGHNSMVESARLQLETYQFEWNERMQTRARKDALANNQEVDKDSDQGNQNHKGH